MEAILNSEANKYDVAVFVAVLSPLDILSINTITADTEDEEGP